MSRHILARPQNRKVASCPSCRAEIPSDKSTLEHIQFGLPEGDLIDAPDMAGEEDFDEHSEELPEPELYDAPRFDVTSEQPGQQDAMYYNLLPFIENGQVDITNFDLQEFVQRETDLIREKTGGLTRELAGGLDDPPNPIRGHVLDIHLMAYRESESELLLELNKDMRSRNIAERRALESEKELVRVLKRELSSAYNTPRIATLNRLIGESCARTIVLVSRNMTEERTIRRLIDESAERKEVLWERGKMLNFLNRLTDEDTERIIEVLERHRIALNVFLEAITANREEAVQKRERIMGFMESRGPSAT